MLYVTYFPLQRVLWTFGASVRLSSGLIRLEYARNMLGMNCECSRGSSIGIVFNPDWLFRGYFCACTSVIVYKYAWRDWECLTQLRFEQPLRKYKYPVLLCYVYYPEHVTDIRIL